MFGTCGFGCNCQHFDELEIQIAASLPYIVFPFVGGLRAVMFTDTLQTLVLVIGAITVCIMCKFCLMSDVYRLLQELSFHIHLSETCPRKMLLLFSIFLNSFDKSLY